MKNKIVINADDCGKSVEVNQAIERLILDNKITSTTIISNMSDFTGAKRLFEEYNSKISFGIHLNLTEGTPLLRSQVLEDFGFYKQNTNGRIEFNGRAFHNKRLPKYIQNDIYNELSAQFQYLLDNGINISHIDSHHHIHTSFSILPIVVQLAKKYKMRKLRSIRNFMPFSLSYLARTGWRLWLKTIYPEVISTDYFCSFEEFYTAITTNKLALKGKSIELMVHPGHSAQQYKNEIQLLDNVNFLNIYNSDFKTYIKL